ncbi:hypothetical protein ACGRHY_14465 [Streptomyces sp. HK10]|uniref:hypothetical protein n=1 Tax=Streptomyces sp. HK10 TaxID=3373255 RepID=UPI0037499335
MQRGTDPPGPTHRVRWQVGDGTTEWIGVAEAPQVTEDCLALTHEPGRVWWVPLHTITGPIEIEAL